MYQVFAYKGYFVGAYPLADGPKRFYGCAQICTELPDDRFKAHSIENVTSVGSYDTPERAMEAAQFQARQVIDSLGPNWDPFTAPGALDSR